MATYPIASTDLFRIRQVADAAALVRSSKVIIEMKDGERIIGQIVGKIDGIDGEPGGIEIEAEQDGVIYRTPINYDDIAWIG